jgi:hypothetical protein
MRLETSTAHARRWSDGIEAVQPPSPPGVNPVRVRTGIDQPVSVGRPAAQMPSLIAGLRAHRIDGPLAGAEYFTFGLVPEHQQQRMMDRVGQINGSTGLGAATP